MHVLRVKASFQNFLFANFIVNMSHYDVKKQQKNTEHASINMCMALIGISINVNWQLCPTYVLLGQTSYRKGRETKHQPAGASCSHQHSCRSISLRFLQDVYLTSPVASSLQARRIFRSQVNPILQLYHQNQSPCRQH